MDAYIVLIWTALFVAQCGVVMLLCLWVDHHHYHKE